MTTKTREMHDLLVRKGAQDRVAERELVRLVVDAYQGGFSHRAISQGMGTVSQATVTRLLQRVAENPELGRETPAAVIDLCVAGDITTEEMMQRLQNWTYQTGYVPTVEGHSTDAYVSKDWDEVERAYYRDLISDEQFETLAARQQELIDRQSSNR